jgi:hypothetical protein
MRLRSRKMLRTALPVAAVLLSLACHPVRPVVDPGERPAVDGTISGMVTASGGAVPVSGRKITAINAKTGAKVEASTTSMGAYTMRVPPGTYRLEMELRSGETVATAPEPTEVEPGDLDAGRDFLLKPL